MTATADRVNKAAVAIVGAGSIGSAWAIVFGSAGHDVRLFDTEAERLAAARATIAARLADLAAFELIDDAPAAILSRVTSESSLTTALRDVTHVQECAPENLDLKRALFADLDRLAPPHATIASSSSFMPASQYAAELSCRDRVLVAHPGNPPYLIRVVEIVPAPFTSAETVTTVTRLMQAAGMTPVTLAREIDGFVFNRLQGALLAEAYALVEDGIIGVDGVDALVRDGLGLRWSLIGPFETVDLNTQGGIAKHAERMGPYYFRMRQARGIRPAWGGELVQHVEAARRRRVPLARWAERGAARDRALMALLRARRRETALKTLVDPEAES